MQEENKSKPSFMERMTRISDEERASRKEKSRREELEFIKAEKKENQTQTQLTSTRTSPQKTFLYIIGTIISVLVIIFLLLNIFGMEINYKFFTWNRQECINTYGEYGSSLCEHRPPLFNPR